MYIIITGATKGIGRSIATLFAKEGFSLCLCARTEKDLEALKKNLLTLHKNIEVAICAADMSIKEDVLRFSEFCKKQTSTPDILINH